MGVKAHNNLRIIDKIGLLNDVEGDVANEIEQAIKSFKKFHWGIEYNKAIHFDNIPRADVVFTLGEIAIIGYCCKKKGDKEPVLYIHGFHNPPPMLCADKNGQMHIIGGCYTVESRGIVH